MTGQSPIGVVLAGVHGYGRRHLDDVLRLIAAPGGSESLFLAGLCDPVPPSGLPEEIRAHTDGVPTSDRLAPLLRDLTGPTVTIVATPIHTHVELALTALEHGSHVLLEKPPAPTLAGFRQLEAAARRTRRAVQIGFQDAGSPALGKLRSLLAEGAIGRLTGIGVSGVWSRDSTYYARSRWAGRRRLDGRDVVDGVLTNPFAHAVAAALQVDGSRRVEDVLDVEVELHRANPIEADDTSCVRIRTAAGTTILVAGTLAAAVPEQPVVIVHGSDGRIEWRYKLGELRLIRAGAGGVHGPGDPEPVVHTSAPPRLVDNLLDHVRDPGVPLLVPLAHTGSFTAVLEAVRLAPDPLPIPPTEVLDQAIDSEPGAGGGTEVRRRTVPGVADLVHRAAEELRLFSELGVTWPRASTAVTA